MEMGGEGGYISLHCHHQNDFCIKMGSDESRFNVSVASDGQSHKTVSTNHNLFEEKGEPKRYRTEVLPPTSLTPYRQAKPAPKNCYCHAVSFYSPRVAVGHYSSIELPLPCVTLDRCQKSNCFCHASVIFSISFESVPNGYSLCLWIALRCLNCYCQLWLWIVLKYLELPSKI